MSGDLVVCIRCLLLSSSFLSGILSRSLHGVRSGAMPPKLEAMAAHVPMPQPLDLFAKEGGSERKATELRPWRQMWDAYATIVDLSSKPAAYQKSLFIRTLCLLSTRCLTLQKVTATTLQKSWSSLKRTASETSRSPLSGISFIREFRVKPSPQMSSLRRCARWCRPATSSSMGKTSHDK